MLYFDGNRDMIWYDIVGVMYDFQCDIWLIQMVVFVVVIKDFFDGVIEIDIDDVKVSFDEVFGFGSKL